MSSDASISRVAFVTGAARGIGAATVDHLCGLGYHVVAVDACLGADTNELPGVEYELATVEELEAVGARHPGRVLAVQADVRNAEALTAAAGTAMEVFGRIDVAVAAAAVIIGGQPLWETPATHLRTVLDIDAVGVWNTAAAVVPHMLASDAPQECRFVAVASAAGERGLFHLTAYNAAKHAVIGIVRGLAADLVATGVTAVAVSPGSTDTAMLSATADLYDLPSTDELAKSQLVRRLLTPQELAITISFCCSVEAAALNGSVVSATGGFSA